MVILNYRRKFLTKFVVIHSTILYFIEIILLFLQSEQCGQEDLILQFEQFDRIDDQKIGNDTTLGAMGKPSYLPQPILPEIVVAVKKGYQKFQFNEYLSSLIPTRRSLPDIRGKYCKSPNLYFKNLPRASIIICFYNEAWSVLIRTIYSILDRTPIHLLQEIILVDDASNMDHLQSDLDEFLVQFDQIRLIRSDQRLGLIRARLWGLNYAKASVIIFLDSHCECAIGWLEPLLDRIARNPEVVACPIIDNIDVETFEYYNTGDAYHFVGGFTWGLMFTWVPKPEREKRKHSHIWEPFATPTMAGGLFAIDREYFEHLGTYDPGFDIWGGENLELSFKTWMCGGRIEIIPCSHIGHVNRTRKNYNWSQNLQKNNVRLAKSEEKINSIFEVWMDEYAEDYYKYMRIGETNHLSEVMDRIKLRQKLNCKSFKWYLDNIFPEQFLKSKAVSHGEIRNYGNKATGATEQCLTFTHVVLKPPTIQNCNKSDSSQKWAFTPTGEIRFEDTCLDYDSGPMVLQYSCHYQLGNQMWYYYPQKKLLRHSQGLCLGVNEEQTEITIEKCFPIPRMQWFLEGFNISKIKERSNNLAEEKYFNLIKRLM